MAGAFVTAVAVGGSALGPAQSALLGTICWLMPAPAVLL